MTDVIIMLTIKRKMVSSRGVLKLDQSGLDYAIKKYIYRILIGLVRPSGLLISQDSWKMTDFATVL